MDWDGDGVDDGPGSNPDSLVVMQIETILRDHAKLSYQLVRSVGNAEECHRLGIINKIIWWWLFLGEVWM